MGFADAAFYADRLGRPGRYFRMLFIGYFRRRLSSERGIAWRVTDSLSCGRSWTWS